MSLCEIQWKRYNVDVVELFVRVVQKFGYYVDMGKINFRIKRDLKYPICSQSKK